MEVRSASCQHRTVLWKLEQVSSDHVSPQPRLLSHLTFTSQSVAYCILYLLFQRVKNSYLQLTLSGHNVMCHRAITLKWGQSSQIWCLQLFWLSPDSSIGDLVIQWETVMTLTLREHPERVILEICDLWDTDHISDNWDQQWKWHS